MEYTLHFNFIDFSNFNDLFNSINCCMLSFLFPFSSSLLYIVLSRSVYSSTVLSSDFSLGLQHDLLLHLFLLGL